jgi:hypothetical protein
MDDASADTADATSSNAPTLGYTATAAWPSAGLTTRSCMSALYTPLSSPSHSSGFETVSRKLSFCFSTFGDDSCALANIELIMNTAQIAANLYIDTYSRSEIPQIRVFGGDGICF